MHRQLARISVQIHSRHTKWFPQRCAWLSSYLSVHGSICVRAWLWKPLFADFFSIQCQLAFSNRAFVVKGLASEVSHKIFVGKWGRSVYFEWISYKWGEPDRVLGAMGFKYHSKKFDYLEPCRFLEKICKAAFVPSEMHYSHL